MFHGDVFDTAVLQEAMDGVDDVYYCVVDTRAWLRDTSPLFRTNVEGLRSVLDVAVSNPACAGSCSPAPTRRSGGATDTWRPKRTSSAPAGFPTTSDPGSRPRTW